MKYFGGMSLTSAFMCPTISSSTQHAMSMRKRIERGIFAASLLGCLWPQDIYARDKTGPDSPILKFMVVKEVLTRHGMILRPGEIYPGQRYPRRQIELNVANIAVLVLDDEVVVYQGPDSSEVVPVAELEENEKQQKQAKRELQSQNPDFYKYSTGKMSEADRRKLEAEASDAGMSVEEYTSLSGLDRYKARQRKTEDR